MSTPTNTANNSVQQGTEAATSNNSTENLEVSQEPNSSVQANAEGKTEEVKAEEVKKAVKTLNKLKLKVDQKEYEETLPFDLPDDPKAVEYITKQLQMARMGQKRAQDFSTLEKEVSKFFQDLQKNPRKVLSDKTFGVDIKKLVTEYLEEEVANSQKSPEQLEKEKLETRLKELEDERKTEKEEYQKKEFERLQEKAYMDYDAQMSAVLDKSDLPKTPYVVKKMADYMLMGLNSGLDISPADVLPIVQEEIFNDLKELIGALGEDKVEKLIGKDILKKVRQKNIAKAKAPAVPIGNSVQDTGKKVEVKADGKKKTIRELWGI